MGVHATRRHFVFLTIAVVGAACAGILTAKLLSGDGQVKQLVLAREVIIRDELQRAIIQPQALTRTGDGGYVIAGMIQATKNAWAIKIDRDGKVLWRYDRELELRERRGLEGGAQFKSVVEMSDGSLLLCGSIRRAVSKTTDLLLVHLDSSGGLLSEKSIIPKFFEGADSEQVAIVLSSADKLVRWGEGAAVLGQVLGTFSSAGNRSGRASAPYYWVAKLDGAANVEWTRPVSTLDGSAFGVISAAIAPDESLVFVGRRSIDTEIFRVDSWGAVRAHVHLHSVFKLAIPIVPDGTLRIFGNTSRAGNYDNDWSLITLGPDLKSTGILRGSKPSHFELRDPDVFRLPDGSLAVFGSVSSGPTRGSVSRIAVVSSTLRDEFDLDPTQPPFIDGAALSAAVPTGKPGEFAVVKSLQKRTHKAGDPEARIGMAIDFVQIE